MNYSFMSKFKKHANASVVLIFFTVLAFIIANVQNAKYCYFSFWINMVSLSI